MNLEKEIAEIRERNRRVEQEKAWEVSWVRALFIVFVTYGTAGVWLALIHDSYPWAKALVPAAGYLFSTFSLPMLKRRWIAQRHNCSR